MIQLLSLKMIRKLALTESATKITKGVQYSKTRITRWFFIWVSLHVAFWTIAPALLRSALPLDSAEGIAWGNMWLWGYEKHPFLAPWLTAFAAHLTTSTSYWTVYFLSQIMVAISFWAIWRLANRMMPGLHALIAAMLLEGVYYYNIASPEFNPNIMMLATWSLLIFTFYIAMKEQKTWQWVSAGVLAGLSMVSKYESALILISILIFTLINKENRKIYKNKNVYIALAITILIFVPNFIWMANNHFLPITYAVDRLNVDHYSGLERALNHVIHPGYFFFEQVGAFLPSLLFFVPFFFCKRDKSSIGRFNWTFLWVVGAGPLILTLLDSLLTGGWLNAKWAVPYFSCFGIMLIAWWRPIITKRAFKQFILIFALLLGLVFSVRAAWFKVSAYVNHDKITAVFPEPAFSNKLTAVWYQHYNQPLRYVAGRHVFVEYIVAYAKNKMIPYFNWSADSSPWVNEAAMKKAGALFVWKEAAGNKLSAIDPEIKKRFPRAIAQPVVTIYPATKAKMTPYYVGVALLPPENQ